MRSLSLLFFLFFSVFLHQGFAQTDPTSSTLSFEEITAKLEDNHLEVKLEGVQELGALNNQEAFDILVQRLPGMMIVVREECMKVFAVWEGALRDSASKVMLERLFFDNARTVRRLTASLLGEMAALDRHRMDEESQERAKLIVDSLRQSLSNDPSRTVRGMAIRGLTSVGDKKNLKLIADKGLRDKYQTVRLEAVKAFEVLDDGEHTDILVEHFQKERGLWVRETLLQTVHKISPEKGIRLLAEVLLTRDKKTLKILAIELLKNYRFSPKELRDKAIELFERAYLFAGSDQSLRFVILEAFIEFGTEEKAVQRVLQRALKDKKKLREKAQEALGLSFEEK
jgi:HEAT repeat protein